VHSVKEVNFQQFIALYKKVVHLGVQTKLVTFQIEAYFGIISGMTFSIPSK